MRDAYAGPGLTDPERELADERNRIRELERTRDRFERFAADRGLGGGRGTSVGDDDALAIIDAAARFGASAVDDSDAVIQERERIAAILTDFAQRDPKPKDEYHFYAVVNKQSTDRNGNINLVLSVAWEQRAEVFRAMEQIPFQCFIRMSSVQGLDD